MACSAGVAALVLLLAMPKPSPKLDPVFEKTVARMLATPPAPKSVVKKSSKKAAKGRRADPKRSAAR
jgi:hypothetical protein